MRFQTHLLLSALLLASACVPLPGLEAPTSGVASRTVKAGPPRPSSSPAVNTLKRNEPAAAGSPAASAAPATPTPSPSAKQSFAAELSGLVKVEAGSLLTHKLAALTPQGTLLVSNNGGGLISDKGMGLLSDKGMGLIASDGLRLLSNNSAGLISKTKYRVLTAEAAPSGLLPVQGMAVLALDLLNGRILAGPEPTDAQGRYTLHFSSRPTSNLGVLAVVPDAEAAPAMSFGSLAHPEPQSTPLITSDTSQAITGYILSVMPHRLQPIIDARKAGNAPDAYLASHAADPQAYMLLKTFDNTVKKVPVEKLRQADQDGELALGISTRVAAYLDFKRPHYRRLEVFAEQIRAYGATLNPAPTPPLLEQIFTLMHQKGSREPIKALLLSYGKPEAEVTPLADEVNDIGNEIVKEMAETIPVHQTEILAPLLSLLAP